MSATIHPSSVIIRCPLCKKPMFILGEQAWCENIDCEDHKKTFAVEYPTVDVKLTPITD